LRQRRPGVAVILIYHRVADVESANDPWHLAVSPAHFAEHLATIRERFRPLTLTELEHGLAGRSVPRGSVVVTFDDGYRDNLHVAKPLLGQHGVPATVFVLTGYLGAGRDFWWDECEALLRTANLPELADPRLAWRRLRELPHGERLDQLDRLWEHAGLERPPASLVSSAEEIVELAEGELIEIGGHTATHPRLPGLPPAAQLEEIRSSKTALENLLSQPVLSFSYPHGQYDRTTVDGVRKAGFRRACASGERAVPRRARLLELPRLEAPNVGGEELGRLLDERLA
jgi:peptidoglycan/xylan/chitin deacetylase (PgdA/CDA1 family)